MNDVSEAIAENKPDLPTCTFCGAPAVCVGRYEMADEDQYGCDVCCGHGCEDGYCVPLETTENVE